MTSLFNMDTKYPNSGSGFGYTPTMQTKPIFVNFYPQQLPSDFKLRDTIQKLKYQQQQFPTLTNGNGVAYNTNRYQPNMSVNGGNGGGGLGVGTGLGAGTESINMGKPLNPIILIPSIGASKIFRGSDMIWYMPSANPTNAAATINRNDIVPMIGSVDWLPSTYMLTLCEALNAIGYARGNTLLGAGYDFRQIFTDSAFSSYSDSLVRIIQKAVATNGKKAILISHGLGACVVAMFLNNMSKQWKDTYLQCQFMISPTIGGSPKALRTMLSGEQFPLDMSNRIRIRDLTKNFSGLHMMLPLARIYGSTPLVTYNHLSYTAADIPVLMKVAGFEDKDIAAYSAVAKKHENLLAAPDITTYVLYGTEVPTESSYTYVNSIDDVPNKTPFQTNSGDGTMPDMGFVEQWRQIQKDPVYVRRYKKCEHVTIMSMQEPIQDVLVVLMSLN